MMWAFSLVAAAVVKSSQALSMDEQGGLMQAAVQNDGKIELQSKSDTFNNEEIGVNQSLDSNESAIIKIDDASDSTWGMDDFQELKDTVSQALDSFDPEKLKEALGDPEKLLEFASRFTDQLQASVNKTEHEIRELQLKTKSEVRSSKDAAVLKIAEQVDKFGRLAQRVVEQLAAKTEEARSEIKESISKVEAANVSEKVDKVTEALNAQVQTLQGLVMQLRQAMNRLQASLVQGPAADAEKHAKEVLSSIEDVLGDAKTYIAFVNKSLTDAEAKMLVLSEHIAADGEEKATAYTDHMADDLVAVLERLNSMLRGELDFRKAEAYVKSSSIRICGSLLAFFVGIVSGLGAEA